MSVLRGADTVCSQECETGKGSVKLLVQCTHVEGRYELAVAQKKGEQKENENEAKEAKERKEKVMLRL
jgi:RecJ-like exonuclease